MREGFLKRIIECSSELFSNDDKEIKEWMNYVLLIYVLSQILPTRQQTF